LIDVPLQDLEGRSNVHALALVIDVKVSSILTEQATAGRVVVLRGRGGLGQATRRQPKRAVAFGFGVNGAIVLRNTAIRDDTAPDKSGGSFTPLYIVSLVVFIGNAAGFANNAAAIVELVQNRDHSVTISRDAEFNRHAKRGGCQSSATGEDGPLSFYCRLATSVIGFNELPLVKGNALIGNVDPRGRHIGF